MRAFLRSRSAWWLILVLGLLPLTGLVWGVVADQLGVNPAETLIRSTGDWALRLLCLTLAVTPLRVMLGWPELLRFRRLMGLLTFTYACLHLLCYAGFDMGFVWADIVHDIPKRPFVLVGSLAFVVLCALAATSWNGAIHRMGARNWQALHRSIYAIAVLAILHFWWMRASKHNFAEVWVYGLILAVLLFWRVINRIKRQ
ncbi:protein-methionine-sulfoxide reductase heme-binding subunit MsrQ [Limnohabitans sp.]|uniref:sulfite oxidase heme-binding subunit YedZ n=1 Tax=Limnohabitans sp. TaxID=1907725 RepID=UPI0031202FD1